jgi:integrase
VNIQRRQLVIRRAVISKYVDTPKSGHGRVIDLSSELAAALGPHLAASSLKTGRVFRQDSGRSALARHLYAWMDAAAARAGIPKTKGTKLHVMRHSACSALAALGAPMIAIQSLAGHQSPQKIGKHLKSFAICGSRSSSESHEFQGFWPSAGAHSDADADEEATPKTQR